MPVTIPELKDLTSEVRNAIQSASVLKNKKVTAILNEGQQDADIAEELRLRGVVVEVHPIAIINRRDQGGPRPCLDATIAVKLQVNVKQNKDSNTNLNIYEAISSIIKAVTSIKRHQGGEFFQVGKTSAALSKFDEGIWAYQIMFTKELLVL